MRVALFIPCLTENFFPATGLSTVKLLNHLGIHVRFIKNQTCCGLPAYNAGHIKQVLPLAKHFISLFKEQDYVVAPSGSCVSMVRSFYQNLNLPEADKKILMDLNRKVFELTEFIVDVLQVTDIGGKFSHKVTYHDSCHLNRELGIKSQPRRLLKAVRDLELVEMEGADHCCGFGGTFSAKWGNLSVSMVKQKCENILNTGAEYCVGADSSCLMNISGYMVRQNIPVKTLHIADLLAMSIN